MKRGWINIRRLGARNPSLFPTATEPSVGLTCSNFATTHAFRHEVQPRFRLPRLAYLSSCLDSIAQKILLGIFEGEDRGCLQELS